MADPSPPPGSRAPGVPRWVKVLAIVAAIVVLLVAVVVLLGGGEHGPGRHLRGGDSAGKYTPPVEHTL